MKLEIDGILRGRDLGYSVKHPDSNLFFEFCGCQEPHCHLPGETSKERHHYACLMMAAPEMLELLQSIRAVMPRTACAGCTVDNYAEDIDALLAKINGGGE